MHQLFFPNFSSWEITTLGRFIIYFLISSSVSLVSIWFRLPVLALEFTLWQLIQFSFWRIMSTETFGTMMWGRRVEGGERGEVNDWYQVQDILKTMLLATISKVVSECMFSILWFYIVFIIASRESQTRKVPYRPLNTFNFMDGEIASQVEKTWQKSHKYLVAVLWPESRSLKLPEQSPCFFSVSITYWGKFPHKTQMLYIFLIKH